MNKKTKQTMGDLREFCRENGYLAASYKLAADNKAWLPDNTEANHDDDTFSDEMIIICDKVGTGIDYRDCITTDGKYVFRLHNNYNLPDLLPKFANVL